MWERFRGGLVFKAHRLLYHSTLGLRVIKKEGEGEKNEARAPNTASPAERLRENLADFNEKLFQNLYQSRLDGPVTCHVLVQISRFLIFFCLKSAKCFRNRSKRLNRMIVTPSVSFLYETELIVRETEQLLSRNVMRF